MSVARRRFCGLGLPEIDDECFGALQHCLHLRDSERPARKFREVTMAEKICERIAMLRQRQIRQAREIAQKLVRGAVCCANRKHFFDETAARFPRRRARMALRCFRASTAACFRDARAQFRKRACAFRRRQSFQAAALTAIRQSAPALQASHGNGAAI